MALVGDPIEFEFSSADASTAAPLVLRLAGKRESLALAASDRFILHSVNGSVATTTAQIIADTDGDGDVDAHDMMVALGTGINNASFEGIGGGIAGSPGVIPKVKAAAGGQITLTGTGCRVKG